jgi:hypothetical protein
LVRRRLARTSPVSAARVLAGRALA